MNFALLFDGCTLEAWHLRCLEHLRGLKLVGVVIAPRARDAPRRRGGIDVRARYAHARRIALDARPEAAEGDAPDFVLRLGAVELPGGVEGLARYGVWHFAHEAPGSEPAFLRETCFGERTTTARLLVRCAGRSGDRILLEGRLRTDLLSGGRQRSGVEDVVAKWPAYACERIARGGFERCLGELVAPAPEAAALPGALALALRLAPRRLAFAWRRYFRQAQWNVGVLRQPVAAVLAPGGYRDDRIDWFPLEGRERFLADPFGVPREGAIVILCECYGYRSARGWISALEWGDGRFRWAERHALERDVHMSYPCLVEEGGRIYCIPETSEAGEIALYRSEAFPKAWTRVAALVEGFDGVDPTVFRHEGRWWLFSTRRGAEADAALWIWHAQELPGPWRPHALNPVKIDVAGARPGGAPFVHEGSLYRPVQDCSRHYGWRIVLQRVTRLSPAEFAETPVGVIEAGAGSPFPLGRHTFTPVGDVVLVDGHREVFVWHAFVHILRITGRDLKRTLARLLG